MKKSEKYPHYDIKTLEFILRKLRNPPGCAAVCSERLEGHYEGMANARKIVRDEIKKITENDNAK